MSRPQVRLLEVMDMSEQMPAPRIPLNLDVDFRRSYGRNAATGILKNISLSGAFLEHELEALGQGDKVQVTFRVGGRNRKVSAEIIWTNGAGCGIKFLPSNNRDIQIVDDLMYFVEAGRQDRRSLLNDILKETG